jgi:hypothetical protein
VLHFVRSWDEQALGREWLLGQLRQLWQERLADAEAVQQILRGEDGLRDDSPAHAAGGAAVC